jgi:hypothetical protein
MANSAANNNRGRDERANTLKRFPVSSKEYNRLRISVLSFKRRAAGKG